MPNEIAVELVQVGPSTTEGHIRQHRLFVDRPLAKGGGDRGPMGGELFLAALGGCFMSNLLAAIAAREAPVSQVTVRVVGTLADTPPRYQAVDLRVTAVAEDRAQLATLVEIADRGCIMTNTVRGAVALSVRVV